MAVHRNVPDKLTVEQAAKDVRKFFKKEDISPELWDAIHGLARLEELAKIGEKFENCHIKDSVIKLLNQKVWELSAYAELRNLLDTE